MDNKHTPGPWIIVPQSDGSAIIAHEYETGNQMRPKGLRLIAHVMTRGNSLAEDEANAAHIVLAVNHHEALVEALRECLPFIDDAEDIAQFFPDSAATDQCRAAVAKARAILSKVTP